MLRKRLTRTLSGQISLTHIKRFLKRNITSCLNKIGRQFTLDTNTHIYTLNQRLDRHFAAFSQQTKQLLKCYTKTSSDLIHCVFVAQLPEIWSSWHTVWEALITDHRFRVTVLATPFYSHWHNPDQVNNLKNFLLKRGIPFLPYEDFDLTASNVDIIFLQNPYDETRPHTLQVKNLIKKIVYIPYALDIGGGEQNQQLQFNLSLQQRAWRIFVRSRCYKEKFEAILPDSQKVIISGHPRLDLICSNHEAIQREAELIFEKIADKKLIILVNMHFDILAKYSTFMLYKDTLLQLARAYPKIGFIFRPHPFLFGYLKDHQLLSETDTTKYLHDLSNLSNVIYDTNPDYMLSLILSHALISDISSLLLEYFPTGKPVLYLRQTGSPGLNQDREILDFYSIADSSNDLFAFLEALQTEAIPKINHERLKQVDKYFYQLDGLAGDRIKNHLLEAFQDESL